MGHILSASTALLPTVLCCVLSAALGVARADESDRPGFRAIKTWEGENWKVEAWVSLASEEHKEAEDSWLCAASKSVALCLQPYDPTQLDATAFEYSGSSLDFNAALSTGKNHRISVGAFGGIQWRIFDSAFNLNPGLGDPYVKANVTILFKDVFLTMYGYILDRYRGITTQRQQRLAPVGISERGGVVRGGWRVLRSRRAEIVFSVGAESSQVVVASREYAAPRDEFEEMVELRLVGSRPLQLDDIEALLVKVKPRLDLRWDTGFAWAHGVAEFKMITTPAFATRNVRSEVALTVPIEWFRIALEGNLQSALDERAPVFALPSLGGEFGMFTLLDGALVNTKIQAANLQMGHWLLRGFVEAGESSGVGPATTAWGGGLLLDFGEIVRQGDAEGYLPPGMEFVLPKVAIGANSIGGFAVTVQGGGTWDL